ncbi:MAG: RidA family protein [Rhodospirillales bacterium]|jgi:reactive intermediate/imine deaminase|nr:RidA family protein [Rhodospirillales bacterium]MDP6772687.1 RidA family protein [Rhodospirillales bacterium]
MIRQSINPAGLASPVGPYSYGVRVSGDLLLFVAGCTASDASGNFVGAGDITKQTEQIFDNIGKVLDGAGGTLQDIVRLGLFITDTKLYAKVSEVRARFFQEPYPVSTCVGIAGFVQEEALIEIDAIAMLGRGA